MGRMDVDFRSLRKEVGLYEGVSSRKHKDILRAAEKLFAARGYDGTTTASIAGCAGVTERTLFKHFKSKELLYRRILFPLMFRTVVPEQMEKIKKLLDGQYGDLGEVLAGLIANRMEAFDEHGEKLKILSGELLHNDRMRGQFSALWRRHLWPEILQFMDRMKTQRLVRRDVDPAIGALVLIIVVMGFVFHSRFFSARSGKSSGHAVKQLAKIIMHGLAPG